MEPELRIAVLRTDFPEDSNYGKFIQIMFDVWFYDLECRSGVKIIRKEYRLRNMEYPTEEEYKHFDGAVIPGSTNGTWEDVPWVNRLHDEIRKLFDRRFPMFGICFGHQSLTHALGGKVDRSDKGLQVACRPFEMDVETVHDLDLLCGQPCINSTYNTTSSPFAPSSNAECTCMSCMLARKKAHAPMVSSSTEREVVDAQLRYSHNDQAILPPGSGYGKGADIKVRWKSLGRSETCEYHGFLMGHPEDAPTCEEDSYGGGYVVMSLQGHPEFTTTPGDMCMMKTIDGYHKRGRLSDEGKVVAVDSLTTMDTRPCSHRLAEAVLGHFFINSKRESRSHFSKAERAAALKRFSEEASKTPLSDRPIFELARELDNDDASSVESACFNAQGMLARASTCSIDNSPMEHIEVNFDDSEECPPVVPMIDVTAPPAEQQQEEERFITTPGGSKVRIPASPLAEGSVAVADSLISQIRPIFFPGSTVATPAQSNPAIGQEQEQHRQQE